MTYSTLQNTKNTSEAAFSASVFFAACAGLLVSGAVFAVSGIFSVCVVLLICLGLLLVRAEQSKVHDAR